MYVFLVFVLFFSCFFIKRERRPGVGGVGRAWEEKRGQNILYELALPLMWPLDVMEIYQKLCSRFGPEDDMCLQGFPWPQMTQFRSPPHPFVHDLLACCVLSWCRRHSSHSALT